MTSPPSSPSISDYESADSQHDRPNRWLGPAKTWQNITASDRAVASSLDLARNRDLSVHLYNAHALKRKARQRKDDEEEECQRRDWRTEVEDTKGFVPLRSWGAWPLAGEDVPRDVMMGVGEEWDDKDGLERFTIKRRVVEEGSSGRVLEDVLVARTLRHAKERFYKRMALQDDVEENDPENDVQRHYTEDEGIVDDVQSPPRKKSKKSSKNNVAVQMVPVLSTDDDRSQELLRPSIRSTLAKLDELLVALHHARSTCLQVANESSDSDTEITPQQSQSTPTKRLQGRVRKFENAQGAPTVAEFIAGVKKTNRGRPKKHIPRLDGETDEAYAIRLATIRRVPMPALASARGFASSEPSTPSTQSRHKTPIVDKAMEEAQSARRLRRLELRDWSDVLGMAALVGFDQNVISRATQRCADLFGEGMSMRTMVETPFGESKDMLESYYPEPMPKIDLKIALDYKDLQAKDNDDMSGVNTSERYFCTEEGCTRTEKAFRDQTDLRRHMARIHLIRLPDNKNSPKRIRSPPPAPGDGQIDLKSLLCLVEGCKKAGKPYINAYSLKRHFNRTHQISEPEENTDDEDDDVLRGEEMYGGVHVDGFLQPFDFPLKHVDSLEEPKKLRAKKVATRSIIIPQGYDDDDEGEEAEDYAEFGQEGQEGQDDE